jgi:hypothetical protein
MTKPLIVDPSRLKIAGTKLQTLAFPVPPSPITASGTDSVSAAINETLPIIESPVVEGLPFVKAALTRTGSNIATAAGMYTEADQLLGGHLSQVQFLATGAKPAGGASADQFARATADQPIDGETPSTPEPAPQPGQSVPQLGQLAGTAGTMGTVAQNVMQGAQGAIGSMPGSGPMPAQLATDSTKTDQPAGDQAQLVDETKTDEEEQQPEALAEGAAPGDKTLESIPVQPPTPGRPVTTPSEINL